MARLTVFCKVHELDQVKELEHIFHNGRARKSRGGATLSLETLKVHLAACSAYVNDRGRRQEERRRQEEERRQEENSE